MKQRVFRIVCLILSIAVLTVGVSTLIACGETPTPPSVPSVQFFKDGAAIEGKPYVLIYKDGDTGAQKMANELNNAIRGAIGIRLEVKSDKEPVGKYEILVGATNREISKKLTADIAKKPDGDFVWGYYVDGNSLAISAKTPEAWNAALLTDNAWTRCLAYFRTTLVRDGSLSLKSNLRLLRTLTEAEHAEELAAIEEERRQEELKAEQERLEAQEKELEKLLPLLSSEFSISDFYGSDIRYSWQMVKDEVAASENNRYQVNYNVTTLYDMTADQQKAGYATPTLTPTVGQHPRLLFTEADIPDLKALLKSAKSESSDMHASYKALLARVESETDGILQPIVYKSPDETKQVDNKRNNSNFSAGVLANIQAKAFWYAVTGEELYGYQAIYAMKNYLKTLDIGFYDSDQCRYYGYTAYIGALVYDWCYDLMSEDDKEQMALGLQNKCFVGYSSLPDGSPNSSPNSGKGSKTEVGFPPTTGTGPVEGHGTEMTILRDYLSVAIAIYDEEPSWYNLIGGRMFHEYIPIRNFYYEAGIYPEGTSTYAPFRYLADMYSAWMMTTSLGENPYIDDMQRVVYSFAAHECGHNDLFSTGDGNGLILRTSNAMGSCLITAHLYNDSTMYAMATWGGMYNMQLYGNVGGVADLTVSEIFICSMNGIEPAEDRHEGMPLITYNDGYYQQIIARNSWETDAPVVLMRGASATTVGHSHQASGEFQIYYKGMLAGDDGVYDNYGSDHHYYYHKATIAHSALLVFNPAKKNTYNRYYSGGQPKLSSTTDIYEFMNGDYFKTGEVTGVAYKCDDAGVPKYVYYANDLTLAYHNPNVVDYVGRTMLTTFTGDETFPMFLFVYDRIDVPKTDYTKSFLLQCAKAPVVDTENQMATVDNGAGKLVLKSLIGCGSIAAYGGETGADPQRYWISTQNKNLPSFGGLSSGAGGNGTGGNTNGHMWGKVEIQAPAGNKSDVMMNVLYVTDSETEQIPDMKALNGSDKGYVGAIAHNQVAVFVTETGTDYRTGEISVTGITGTQKMDYYVGGLAAGKWQVKVNSTTVGEFTVADGEHFLTFNARAGKLTLTPIGN